MTLWDDSEEGTYNYYSQIIPVPERHAMRWVATYSEHRKEIDVYETDLLALKQSVNSETGETIHSTVVALVTAHDGSTEEANEHYNFLGYGSTEIACRNTATELLPDWQKDILSHRQKLAERK